jgi:hypothetical protein
MPRHIPNHPGSNGIAGQMINEDKAACGMINFIWVKKYRR